MSLLGFLKFALNFLDVLAWPLFALGYPLIQFWPHIKLLIICWLVVPYFDGAFYVYNHLVRPCLLLNPKVVVDEFNKWMVLLWKRDRFLAEAERDVKGNEPEALEKLINKEFKTKTPNVDVEDIKAIAATEKKEMEWEHSKEPDIVQKDNKAMEVIEKKEVPVVKRFKTKTPNVDVKDIKTIAATEKKEVEWSHNKELDIMRKDNKAVEVIEKKEVLAVKRMVLVEPSLHQTDNKTSATIEIKGPVEIVAAARELPDIQKVRKEWTCAICQVTTASKKRVHFRGKKHKAMFEALKPKNQPNVVPASTAKKTCQPSVIYIDEEKTHGRKRSRRKKPLA